MCTECHSQKGKYNNPYHISVIKELLPFETCVTYVPMQDTIARARIAEAFMNASATAGLSDNLEHLAKLVDEEDEDDGMTACISTL